MKIDSKRIIDINVSVKIIKLLEENTEVHICDFGEGNIFLAITPKIKANKWKTLNKLDLVKI